GHRRDVHARGRTALPVGGGAHARLRGAVRRGWRTAAGGARAGHTHRAPAGVRAPTRRRRRGGAAGGLGCQARRGGAFDTAGLRRRAPVRRGPASDAGGAAAIGHNGHAMTGARVTALIPVKDDERVTACVRSLLTLAGEVGELEVIVV